MEEPRTFESKVRGFLFLWARWDLNPRRTASKAASSSLLGYGPATRCLLYWASRLRRPPPLHHVLVIAWQLGHSNRRFSRRLSLQSPLM